MADKPTDEPTQKTQPVDRDPPKEKPEPIDIPIPSKSQIMRDFEKIATPDDQHDDEDEDS